MSVLVLMLALAAATTPAEVYHGIAVPPGGTKAWVVTIETTAVYHTTNFGATWEPQEISTFRDFFDVFFLDEQRGWTCGRVGDIWHTADAGENWTRQNLGGPKFATRIRFLDEMHGWASGGEAMLLRTINGGEEWDIVFFPNPPYPADTVDFQGGFFVNPSLGWLVAGRFPDGDTFARGQGYITRTTDGGANWVLQRRDSVLDFYDAAFHDEQTGWVVGGDDQTMQAAVLRTTDAGENWAALPMPPSARLLRAATVVGDYGWACGRNGTIIRTTDQGRTWESQATGVDTTLFDIEFGDTLRGMAAGNSVVLHTVDGGRTWSRCLGGVSEHGPARVETEPRITARPNPSRGPVSLSFPAGSVRPGAELRVYDASGTSVWEVRASARGLKWDGVRSDGRQAGAGVYLARLTNRSGASPGATARFTLLPR